MPRKLRQPGAVGKAAPHQRAQLLPSNFPFTVCFPPPSALPAKALLKERHRKQQKPQGRQQHLPRRLAPVPRLQAPLTSGPGSASPKQQPPGTSLKYLPQPRPARPPECAAWVQPTAAAGRGGRRARRSAQPESVPCNVHTVALPSPRRPYHFAACPALRRVGQERTNADRRRGVAKKVA